MWGLYKPVGVNTDMSPGCDLSGMIPEKLRKEGYKHVGRLDRDTTGLLLFSNDGALTNAMLETRSMEKVYIARVPRNITSEDIAMLKDGVELNDGFAQAPNVHVIDESDLRALPLFIWPRTVGVASEYHVVTVGTTFGRFRVVRRMLAHVGLPVLGLHRESIGPIRIPSGVMPGEMFQVPDHECLEIRKLLE
jgi:23S rRNA pseudouridine2605 synthase